VIKSKRNKKIVLLIIALIVVITGSISSYAYPPVLG
jgi:hypothetical protein